jgi:hypothetical protein
LIPEIENYKSKLVLYNYDSFLIDFNVDDGLEYLNKIKRILEKDKFPVKINCGNTYNDMEDITEKFII